jgi:tetraacyldisaccharide 4'-kinase
MIQAPAFWWQNRQTLAGRLLQPLGQLYGRLTSRRMARLAPQAPIPVICVGNFVVGGAGKTPTALALAGLLKARGEQVYFLSRGHGGQARVQPLLVEPDRHQAGQVGDEPLLLARAAPTIVCRDRLAGALHAARHGASVVIMDDGMQNPSIAKNLALAVVDGEVGVGNGRCFPAGPLRAPLADQMPWADGLVVIGEMREARAVAALAQSAGKSIFKARLQTEPQTAAGLDGKAVYAFAGIGRPDKFFETLASTGAVVTGTRAFPDHHPFTAGDCLRLQQAAGERRALLVTTEKDAVRLPRSLDFVALPIRLVFADERQVGQMLVAALARARG